MEAGGLTATWLRRRVAAGAAACASAGKISRLHLGGWPRIIRGCSGRYRDRQGAEFRPRGFLAISL